MTGSAGRSIVGGRGFERAYLFGSSAAGVLVGAALLLHPAWTVPAWWLFTLLADGPHLLVTVTRSYLDPRDRRRLGRTLWLVPLWILVGPAALAAGKATGSRAPWTLFLIAAATWSTYHFIRQHAGLLAVCERRAAADRISARVDALFLQGALWTMTVLFLLVVPAGRGALTLPPGLSRGEGALAAALALALGGAGLGWLALQGIRARRGGSLLPVWFVLGPILALYAFNLFVVGSREPLVERPLDVEQGTLAVAVVGGLVHALQYLGIVAATNRRRHARAAGDGGLAARLGRAPLLAYAAFAAISIAGYGLLNAARGAPGLALFGVESDAARLCLGVYWGLFFMHYHLDQRIWHPSRDPGLREELGLA